MKNKKTALTIIIFIIYTAAISLTAFAHPGRTDANGGHYNRKTGEYHYHNGGSSSGSSSKSSSSSGSSSKSSSSSGSSSKSSSSSGSSSKSSSSSGSSSKSSSSSGSSSASSSAVRTPAPVYASRIDIPNMPANIKIGESVQLNASVYPSDAVDQTITWESSDASIAAVDANGNLNTLQCGTVTISALTSGGARSDYTVTIEEIAAEKIEIANKTEQITLGQSIQLETIFTPQNTTNKDIVYTSSDESAVQVSADGTLTAAGVGKAVITAVHNEITDQFEITVNPVMAQSIAIYINEQDSTSTAKPSLHKDETLQLYADILPDNTTNKTLVWTSDNEDVVTVDENGLVSAHNAGDAVVKATADNGVYSEFKISVIGELGTVATVIFAIIGAAVCISPVAAIVFVVKKIRKKVKKIN